MVYQEVKHQDTINIVADIKNRVSKHGCRQIVTFSGSLAWCLRIRRGKAISFASSAWVDFPRSIFGTPWDSRNDETAMGELEATHSASVHRGEQVISIPGEYTS
jgi:hypothetical protein